VRFRDLLDAQTPADDLYQQVCDASPEQGSIKIQLDRISRLVRLAPASTGAVLLAGDQAIFVELLKLIERFACHFAILRILGFAAGREFAILVSGALGELLPPARRAPRLTEPAR
jgi:hypothetical protein